MTPGTVRNIYDLSYKGPKIPKNNGTNGQYFDQYDLKHASAEKHEKIQLWTLTGKIECNLIFEFILNPLNSEHPFS